MTRVSAGPYTLEIPPNGVAILHEADGAGTDHQLPGGVGYLDALVQFAGEVFIRLKAMLEQMQIDRRDHDLAIRDAISETASCADELAFWRYQAIWSRAYLLVPSTVKRPWVETCDLEQSPEWKEAERQLEANRVAENRGRYAHAEAPRDPGAT